ncbi:MAG: ZPR1 zinc finger domain-containing protein [Candidatus Nanoarchaeia archaeon]|nr:ZPR1 zinc finger domain-containing protein [Candidatus Nanoarchaeia archaeon]
MDKVEGERCPMCGEKKLTLIEDEQDIPYFGKTFIFSMQCSGCGFLRSDVEAAEQKEPCKITFKAEKEADLKVRLVKSSEATVTIPELKAEMSPGEDSIGFVTNVEGMIDRFEKIIQAEKKAAEEEDDTAVKTKCKNLLKKIWNMKCGEGSLTIIIEDPSGNSAIISEKSVVEPLKGKVKKAGKKAA